MFFDVWNFFYVVYRGVYNNNNIFVRIYERYVLDSKLFSA